MRQKRLMFFCGKGGVGKTVVAAAYARKMARRKKKVLLTSMTSRDYLETIFRVEMDKQVVPAQKNIDLLRLDARKVMDDLIRRKMPLASYILKHPVYNTIVNTTPGLQEVLTLTTLDTYYHAREGERTQYDLIVVDALSTGHMKSMLQSPQKAMQMIPAGGLHELAQEVEKVFHDPENSAVVVVTTLEEMPVNETVELVHYCDAEGFSCEMILANQVLPPLMDKQAWELFNQIKGKPSLWKEAERGMQQAGYPFELPQRLLRSLTSYQETYLEQQEHRHILHSQLPDKEIAEIPLFQKGGVQLINNIMRRLTWI